MLPGAAYADVREPATVGAFVGPVRDKGPDEQPASNRGPRHELGHGEGRSYLVPGAGILAYLFLLNRYDRHLTEPQEVYRTNGDTGGS